MPGASSFEDWIAQQVQRGASALAPTPAPAPSYEDAFAAFLKQSAPRPVPDLGGMASDAFAQAMRTNPADITIEPNVPSDLGLPSPTGYDAFAASVSRASQRPAPPDLAAASEAAGAVARPAPTDPADIVRDPGAAEVRAVKAAEYAPPGPAPAPVVAAAPTLPAPPPEAPPPTLPPPPAGYDAFAASVDRATQPFGRGVVPDLAAASDAAGAVVRDPATGEARLGVNPADITIEPNMVGDVNLADITLESEDQANNGGVLYADPANHAAVQADALAQLNAAHPPQAAAGLALRTSPPPGAEFATPTLPAPSSTIDDIQIEQPDYALENDLARLAKSETFAPDRDPTPEGRAAEQAFERAMASDKRIREDAARLNAMDPFERAAEMERRKRAQEVERQRLELDAMEKDNAERAANIKRREMATLRAQADMNDVRQRAAAMSDRSPFESWWSDRSTPQKFAGFIAAIASGLGNLNGPNSALNMFVQTAEADAAQKWKKLETQRGLAQDALAAAGDDFKEREAIRLASLQQMQRGIEAQLAQLDPEGTAAMRLSEVQQGIAARIQQAQDAAAKEAFDRADKMIARDQEQQKIDLDIRKQNEVERAARARERRAAMGARKPTGLFDDKAVYTVAQWLTATPELKSVLGNLPPGMQLSGKDVKDRLEIASKAGNVNESNVRGESVGAKSDREKLAFEGETTLADPLTGAPLGRIFDPNRKKFLDETLPSIAQAQQTIDRISRIIDESGGNSDVLQGPEWQAITADGGELDNLVRVGEKMGTLDAGSAEMIKKMRGGVDLNSFIKDARPGLKRLRANLADKANLLIKNARIVDDDGKLVTVRWSVPNLSRPSRAPVDPDVDALSSRGVGPGPLDPARQKLTAAALDAQRAGRPFDSSTVDLSPTDRERIARDLSEKQEQGRAALETKVRAGDKAAAAKLFTMGSDARLTRQQRFAAMQTLFALGAEGNEAALSVLDNGDDAPPATTTYVPSGGE